MHHRYSLIAGLLALAAAGTANAQSRPVSTVTRPAVDPSVAKTTARPGATSPTTLNSGTVSGSPISAVAAGRYQLGLNVQKRNGNPVDVVVIDDTVAVARSGSGVTISSDSMSLTGSVSGPHFTAAGGQSGSPTMSLSLAGSGSTSGSAAGTFSLQRGPSTFTGTFTLVPVPVTAQAHDVITRPAGGHGGGTTSCNLWCKIRNALGL